MTGPAAARGGEAREGRGTPRDAWRVGAIVGVALLALYLAALAPDVTFWDAGEFIAAAHALGIPHPPGTPLFVLLTRAWSELLWFLPTPLATNSFSAVASALAGAMGAWWLARATNARWGAAAGAICAGSMSSIWLNATETEVYAASLALSIVAIWCGDRAGRSEGGARERWRVLVAYLTILAVPLHMSALVAMPAAVFLASVDEAGGIDWSAGVALMAVVVLGAALGLMSAPIGVAGVALLAVSPVAPRPGLAIERAWARRRGRVTEAAADAATVPSVGRRIGRVGAVLWVGFIAATALAFMLIRARFDPPINQGNPNDWSALADVVARRQYPASGLWPRNAPFWLQLGNLFEWADWQSALSLAPGVIPTPWRIAATVVFVVLGVEGCLAHRRLDRRSWWALVVLIVCGSIGIVVYLNLHLGPSFGYGVVPDSIVREARERDYFFVLGFWSWGVWAGMGAVSLVRHRGWRPALGVALAASPALLNWNAVERKREPEASLPRTFADALLEATPPRAVLFVAGDNDTYPLWEAQQVRALRRDVTVVTLPLLPAGWYQAELARRGALLPAGELPLDARAAATLAASRARQRGRPVAVAATVEAADRRRLGVAWIIRGPVYVSADSGVARSPMFGAVRGDTVKGDTLLVDSASTRAWARRMAGWRRGRTPGESIDPASAYAIDILACPAWIVEERPTAAQRRSLASTCNLR